MSIQEIEEVIQTKLGPAIHGLSRSEIEELREWFVNFVEDQLEMTDGFKASIDRAARSLADGKGRVHKPGESY